MKRDDDYIRSLLAEIESSDEAELNGFTDEDELKGPDRRHFHFLLMADAGLVRHNGNGYYRLTNQGHDYLAAIKDDGIWSQTKSAVAETGGSASLEILKQLATGFIKKKISQHTGIEL